MADRNEKRKQQGVDKHDDEAEESDTAVAAAADNLAGQSASGVEESDDDDDDDDFGVSLDPQDSDDDDAYPLEVDYDNAAGRQVPSDVDAALDVRFNGADGKTAPKYGLTIIQNKDGSAYNAVIFTGCKFSPTGNTTFFNCNFNEVTFEDCRFKGKNRFDNVSGTELHYVGCTFDNQWVEDVKYPDGKFFVGDMFQSKRPRGRDEPGQVLKANLDFEGFHFYDECDQEIAPPRGLVIERGKEHELYFCVNFRSCTFDETNPSFFEDCAMQNVTFENCHFSGGGFWKVCADDFRATNCSFRGSVFFKQDLNEMDFWQNHDYDANVHGDSMPEALREKRMQIQKEVLQQDDEARKNSSMASKAETTNAAGPSSGQGAERSGSNGPISGSTHHEHFKDELPEDMAFLDAFGRPENPGTGIIVGRGGNNEVYFGVTFKNCTFDPENLTVFDNCALGGVTFKNCRFSGSLFDGFYAYGLTATDCTFEDCKYVNQQLDDFEEIEGQVFKGRWKTSKELPDALKDQRMRKIRDDSKKEGEEKDKHMQQDGTATSGDEAPSIQRHDGEWDVQAMGKGKAKANGSD